MVLSMFFRAALRVGLQLGNITLRQQQRSCSDPASNAGTPQEAEPAKLLAITRINPC